MPHHFSEQIFSTLDRLSCTHDNRLFSLWNITASMGSSDQRRIERNDLHKTAQTDGFFE